MDSSNLGVVFAPTIMRSVAEDHGTMLAEMGYSKSIVTHLIDSFSNFFVPVPALPSTEIPEDTEMSEASINIERIQSIGLDKMPNAGRLDSIELRGSTLRGGSNDTGNESSGSSTDTNGTNLEVSEIALAQIEHGLSKTMLARMLTSSGSYRRSRELQNISHPADALPTAKTESDGISEA